MKVLIVCNNAYMRGNGVCTAVLSLLNRLKSAGIDARLMACENPDPDGEQPDYPLKHFKVPIFEPIVYANGFRYAKSDKKVITEAVRWADVVHLSEALPLEVATVKIARTLNTPCVGTFHLFTQNIMANLGFRKATLINKLFTWLWRKCVYDYCTHIHCPTKTVRDHLVNSGYKSQLIVISNGIEVQNDIVLPEVTLSDPITLLCIGRLANEKAQNTLLEAMRYSKYAERILLHFAGHGPQEKRYKKLADKLVKKGVLKHRPVFGFYSADELKALARKSYLYIHCAWVEVEGLSCVESLKEGLVPIIAQGEFTAASQFALDERSLFPESNAKALAARIDWWIEHPQERAAMGVKYAESVKNYNISDSIEQMIQMYKDSISI